MSIKDFKEYKTHLTEFELKNCPENLFSEGYFSLIYEGQRVSVVGSRKVSREGKIRADIITKALVEKGITVVSGLAEGVDTIAHNSAIKYGGKTIAVLGTPLSQAYPKANETLLNEIKKNHLAISQFPENYPVRPANFPIRNRTMALISDATIIIEATEKSGTRHQGWEALRLGRTVLILESIANDKSMTWPSEMINYGAQVLTRQNINMILDELPYLTSKIDYAF
ncbi:DNA-processing protein DprA [Aquimarina algiphila]|uniref:DNA-processing protein DprA n=1 Tax=Aquimarina algiphila TaxID=2047982 RepID=A0A554VAD5_9FLAO|nr:DNA-processing protein DprA [Aquimarina algiphila]TSE03044.1 DNA-processing protein DprA [Aquimarina algiphila]